MYILRNVLVTCALFLLAACGGGSSNSTVSTAIEENIDDSNGQQNQNEVGNDQGDNASDNQDDITDSISVGPFDLADYLFSDNLDTVGGINIFAQRLFDADTGTETPLVSTRVGNFDFEEVLGGFRFEQTRIGENRIIEGFETADVDEIDEQSAYTINEMTIGFASDVSDIFAGEFGFINFATPGVLELQRFVSVGDVVFEFEFSLIEVENQLPSRIICELTDSASSFDLSDAVNPFNIASGVFEDVIAMSCSADITDLTTGQRTRFSTEITYFAKGIGPVFGTLTEFIPDERIGINNFRIYDR